MNFWNILSTVCTIIMSVGGAGAIIVGLYRWARKPDDKRDEKLTKHDELLDKDHKRLNALEEAQAEMEETQRILMKSMLALMSHAIDGNHAEGLKQARDDLQEYLIKRR